MSNNSIIAAVNIKYVLTEIKYLLVLTPFTFGEIAQLSLDREREIFSNPLTVEIVESGRNQLVTCIVNIKVTDVNDNIPQFSMSQYTINIQGTSPQYLELNAATKPLTC